MHWLDRIATSVIRRPRLYPRLFPDGWGDEGRLADLLDRIRDRQYAFTPIAPTFEDEAADCRHGSFVSPADVLQGGTESVAVLHVGPAHGRQVALFAANNDHNFETRLRVAELLTERGIGSLIMEHPLYGSRRRHDGPQPVRTVVDFIEMGMAAVVEGVGLTSWLAGSGALTGSAGFSQGGSTAAVVAAMSPIPLAAAPLAASHSSSPVFTGGVLAESVDWEALGGRESALPVLRDILSNLSILDLPAPPHLSTAVLGIARGDGYVPEATILPIVRRWGAEAVYIDPGHASFHLWGKAVQADLIERAFDRFERAGYRSARSEP